ncbi:MAG: TRAP transporter small permease [Pseudomonadota bacterium]
MVHRWLRRLYLGCAVLGGILFVGIAVVNLYQVGGAVFGYIPTSTDEFAGYCMAASAFLALAYVLDSNEHLRVTLVVHRLQGGMRRFVDGLAMILSSLLAGYLAWYMTKLAWVSWQLKETSQGLIAVPLWLPQGAMALGAVVFFVAVCEKAFRVAALREPVDPVGHEGEFHADR